MMAPAVQSENERSEGPNKADQPRIKVDLWSDDRIKVGARWKEEIQKALASARIAVLFVSPDFLASRFIQQNELPPLLQAAENEGVTIFWICLRPCLFEMTPIASY